jgi:hypothetical protein
LRKVLLISTYNFDRRPFNGVPYEFLDTIGRMEEATIVAPEEAAHGLPLHGGQVEVFLPQTHPLRIGLRTMRTRLRKLALTNPRMAQMHRDSRFPATQVEEDHDLCLFICQVPAELRYLRRVHGWRRRARFAAAFILESWSETLGHAADELAILDEFDHVFVMNAASMESLRRYTRTPMSFLTTGVDCLTACPSGPGPRRLVDILALGRHVEEVHRRMLELSRERGLFYQFDLWMGVTVRDWREIRDANAALIQRTRYFVAWAPGQSYTLLPGMTQAGAGAEHPLSTRYFEGAAGGAILLGTRCRSPEFERFFDDADAVVEIAPDGSDFRAVFEAIEADPARRAAIRRGNIVRALRRYDWAYRWEEVLRTAGFEPTQAHRARLAELERRAVLTETAPAPQVVALAPGRGAPADLPTAAAGRTAAHAGALHGPRQSEPE